MRRSLYLKLSLDIVKLVYFVSMRVTNSTVTRTINTRPSCSEHYFSSFSPGLDRRLIRVTRASSRCWSLVFTNKTVIVDRLVSVLTNCLNSLLFSVNINTDGNVPADSCPTTTRLLGLKSQTKLTNDCKLQAKARAVLVFGCIPPPPTIHPNFT